MDDVEPYNGLLLEVGDEFGSPNWFNVGSHTPPYVVTEIKGNHIVYTHANFAGETITIGRNTPLSSFRMRRNNKYMEYDPTQQGDTEEDI